MYDVSAIHDAPEHHDLARCLGTLTPGSWDDSIRSFEERRSDFVFAYPPAAPARNMAGANGGPPRKSGASPTLNRFLEKSWRAGTLYELLSRFGLRIDGAPPHASDNFVPGEFREVARRRNLKLRVLHGGV